MFYTNVQMRAILVRPCEKQLILCPITHFQYTNHPIISISPDYQLSFITILLLHRTLYDLSIMTLHYSFLLQNVKTTPQLILHNYAMYLLIFNLLMIAYLVQVSSTHFCITHYPLVILNPA